MSSVQEDHVTRDLGPVSQKLWKINENIWSRRSDLQGIVWEVGFVPFIPMLFVDRDTGLPSGFNYVLWSVIEQDLNVTSRLVNAQTFGKLHENGQWNGVVGMLQRNELDITFSSMSTTYAR